MHFSAANVTVVLATPNAGYTTKVDQRGATAVRIEFQGSQHRSRIEVWWDNGPNHDVRED